ncbi:unnamed protein product [Lathyrus oleraceus]
MRKYKLNLHSEFHSRFLSLKITLIFSLSTSLIHSLCIHHESTRTQGRRRSRKEHKQWIIEERGEQSITCEVTGDPLHPNFDLVSILMLFISVTDVNFLNESALLHKSACIHELVETT